MGSHPSRWMSVRNGDDGLDNRRVLCEFRKTLRSIDKVEAVRNPRRSIDSASLDERDNLAEVAGQRVSAGEERQLAAVEVRVMETDLALNQSNEHDASALRRQFESAFHGRGVAGGVEHDRGQISAPDVAKLFRDVTATGQRVRDSEMPPAEVEARCLYVHDGEGRVMQLRELDHAEANGTCADDEHEVISRDARALHGMGTDRERLDQRQLVIRERAGAVELPRGNGHLQTHAAVNVHAQHLEIGAAIRSPAAARKTAPAIDVRLDRATVAGLEPMRVVAGVEDLHAELVP